MRQHASKSLEDELREAIESLDPVDNKIAHILSRSLLRILESTERTERDIVRMDAKLSSAVKSIADDNDFFRDMSR